MTDSATQIDLQNAGRRRQDELRHYAFGTHIVTDAQRSRRRARRRAVALGLRRKTLTLCYGIVPEPYLTPLACMNYLMDSLHVRRVSVDEARAAVEKVTQYYSALSQASPLSSSPDAAGGLGAGRDVQQLRAKRRRSRTEEATSTATPGPRPESLSVLATLSASQVNLTQQSINTFVTDIQDALLLEVLRELCETRPLHFTRVSYRDQRRMKESLSRVDVPPGKRAIVVCDRRDPFFGVILGVPPPPTTPDRHSPRATRDQGEAAAAAAANTAVAIQYVTIAHKPIPWRRMVVRNIPRFFYKDCAMAYVERLDEPPNSSSGESFPCYGRARSRSPTRRATLLLGADEELAETDRKRACFEKTEQSTSNDNRDEINFPSSSSSSSSFSLTSLTDSDRDEGATAGSARKERRHPRLPNHQRLFFSREPFFTPDDGAGRETEDPLLAIPRVEVGGDRRNRRRTWVEKLLPFDGRAEREATMAKLSRYSLSHDVE